MQTRNRNHFTTIHTEGALLPADLLQRISENDAALEGLSPAGYHLAPGERLNEAINRSWNRLTGLWESFHSAREALSAGDPGTTLTRERWLLPLFQELGYGRLSTAKAVEFEGKSYPISHRWQTENAWVPLHLIGCGLELDRRTPGAAGAARTNPHSLLQEFLNRSEDVQWGVVSNGLRLRVLRDNAALTRQAYIEFDLESMFAGEVYSDFVLLWLVCHQSRFEKAEKQTECLLEGWSKSAQERGTRALDDLRRGVEEAIVGLGQGFLQHPANTTLRARLKSGDLSAQDYYRQVLRLVYRLIFLFTAEDRDLLLLPGAPAEARARYLQYYSTTHLRALAEKQRGGRHHDRYESLRLVMSLLGSQQGCPELALPALGGYLFDEQFSADLNTALLDNQSLYQSIRSLAFITEGSIRRAVDYRNLGPEELGSVYESLLELHPLLNTDAGTFELTSAAGNERKTTGSYYTPSSLIQVLLDSALDPVIEDAVSRGRRMARGEWRMVNGEWQVVNGEWENEGEKRYVHSVLSRFGSVEKRDGAGRVDVPADQGIPQGGTVRADVADSPSSQFDSSQYRRGLGAVDQDGAAPVSDNRHGQSEGAGNTFDSQPQDWSARSGPTAERFAGDRNPGQADPVLYTQSGKKGSLTGRSSPQPTPHSPFTNPATRFSLLAEFNLLDLKVCDPACGSGHFLIAAAHRIAGKLAEVRAGGDEPSPNETRRALRDVIRHCIYGVDVNPMAVELCKVNLWLESIEPGKPLSFLDAHIKCGNSLVGVGPGMDINQLEVPDEAFTPVTGDDKETAKQLKKRNKLERQGQESWFVTVLKTGQDVKNYLADRTRALDAMPEDSAAEAQAKAEAYRRVNESDEYLRQRQIADLWSAAFFWKITGLGKKTLEVPAPTQGQLRRMRGGNPLQGGLVEQIEQIRINEGFFHWPVEYPEIAERGGFDCVLGNPPWERIKLQEEEFFAVRDPQIAAAPNKAAREKLIKQLPKSNPALARAFEEAKHSAECSSKFVRKSVRYPLTAVGDVNTYALFAEHGRDLMGRHGRTGIIVPTGIATDDTTKDFFGDLVEKRALASLFDFENKEAIFAGVHRSYKFCLLTLSGALVKQARFVFFATRVEHLRDNRRRFTLDPAEIELFNPNTRTMPVFRTRADAELTRAIYQRVPVLVNERTGENPWGIKFQTMFHMSNDSGLFVTEPREGYVPLYEAKMFWHYDHRWCTFDGDDTRELTPAEKQDPNFLTRPRYWVSKKEVDKRLQGLSRNWLIAYRDITNATNERTSIFSIIPCVGVGNNSPILFSEYYSSIYAACLVGNLDSFIFDFPCRHKVGGMHINFFVAKQLPVLPRTLFSLVDIQVIVPRVVELFYTASDLQSFARDLINEIGVETWNEWFPHSPLTTPHSPSPFPWDDDRRALLRAELDAYYARLYGLNRKQLRYILDPADLTPRELEDILDPWEEVDNPLDPAGYDARRAASDFPGETFRVLKEKEFKQYGEYRTRRLVLEAWERLQESGELPEPRESAVQPAPRITEPRRESIRVSAPKAPEPAHPEPPKEEPAQPETPLQPAFSDFGLYKCGVCGKMVMGFEKENHEREKHGGKRVEWMKVR